jgi:hypothetical protein
MNEERKKERKGEKFKIKKVMSKKRRRGLLKGREKIMIWRI